jgi:DNA-binding transcriptional MerR regulator
MAGSGRLRIGEFSRRVGESPEVIRVWEQRYRLVAPDRNPGCLRLYSEQDERCVRAMRYHLDAGLSASEAARLAKLAAGSRPESASATLSDVDAALERSFDALDEPAAQAALDRVLAAFELRQTLAQVIVPSLRRLGERWACTQ